MEIPYPFIIAEVGSNWRQYNDNDENNLRCAIEHIEQAARCGVQAVKFQLFTHAELYGVRGTVKQNRYNLPRKWLPTLKIECEKNKVNFMCTAFSPEGIEVVDEFVDVHKIASAEALSSEFLSSIFKTKKPAFISLGAMTEKNLLWLLHETFEYDVAFLQCVAAYPAKLEDYNLRFIERLKGTNIPFGISDHTKHFPAFVAFGAAILGAQIFEKHFSIDFPTTPDSAHSIGVTELRYYVRDINMAIKIRGDGKKKIVEDEVYMTKLWRRNRAPFTWGVRKK